MEDYKYILIIYPSGMAGNHIANLISLCEGVEQRAITDHYERYLENIYNNLIKSPGFSVNVHNPYPYGEFKNVSFILQNLDEDTLLKNGSYIKTLDKKFVFTCHGFEYINRRLFHDLEFEPIKHIICKWPKSEILNNRHKLGPWFKGDNTEPQHYDADCLNQMSQDPVVSHYLKKLIQDPLYFDLDIFISDDGYEYLQEFLHGNLGLSLPKKYAKLHRFFLSFLNKTFA